MGGARKERGKAGFSNRRRVRSDSLEMTGLQMIGTNAARIEESNESDCAFGGNAGRDLYLRFALTLSKESGAATFHAQAYIPTQPAQAIEDTRISQAHEDPGRQESYFPPARQGAQAGLGETRFPRIVQ